MTHNPVSEFEKAGAEAPVRGGILVEFWQLLRHNKKWWLLPILLVVLSLGVVLLLASTGAAPFIYSLF